MLYECIICHEVFDERDMICQSPSPLHKQWMCWSCWKEAQGMVAGHEARRIIRHVKEANKK